MSSLLGGDPRASVVAAAAVELMVAAADVADDIVDAEWDSAVADQGRALNASFALLLLAQRCAAQLHQHVEPTRGRKIQKMLIDGGLAACTGQDLDLLYEQSATVDEEQAHEMTRRKSGSIVALACQVGAALATDDPEALTAAYAFGSHLGTAAQLLNDLAGIDPMHFQPGTDLQRRKKTLPVAYGLRCAREEDLADILAWYEQPHQHGESGEWELAKRLSDLGALDYTWIVADAHRREALAALDRLVQITGRRAVWQLRRLVPAPAQQMVGSAA
jgi:geranylgeranyl pyrophosphate synthase